MPLGQTVYALYVNYSIFMNNIKDICVVIALTNIRHNILSRVKVLNI